jgi:hypothetical protein
MTASAHPAVLASPAADPSKPGAMGGDAERHPFALSEMPTRHAAKKKRCAPARITARV